MSIQEILELSILISFSYFSVQLSLIDFRTKRIPNSIILPLIASILSALVVIQLLRGDLGWLMVNLGIPALVFTAFFAIYLLYPKGLGMGDIKALFLIGLVLCQTNPINYFYSISLSFILGSLFVLTSSSLGKKTSEFPFGPLLLLPAVGFAILQSLI